MANTNETIADIIAEKRRKADELEASSYKPYQFLRERIAELRQEADRLEAALRREKAAIEADALAVGGLVEASRATAENSSAVGDAAKWREALKVIRRMVNEELEDLKGISDEVRADFISIRGWCDHALAAPPRNCDVGTADEQKKRFIHYCKVCNRRDCACGYEELFRHKCAIKWAQMPYEEGGTK